MPEVKKTQEKTKVTEVKYFFHIIYKFWKQTDIIFDHTLTLKIYFIYLTWLSKKDPVNFKIK